MSTRACSAQIQGEPFADGQHIVEWFVAFDTSDQHTALLHPHVHRRGESGVHRQLLQRGLREHAERITLLADMSVEQVDEVLAEAGQITLASGAVVTRAELNAQLDKIRSDGYALSISERQYGIASVTAPVRAPDDTLVGVLGVTGNANDFTDTRIAQLTPEVRRAATALGERPAT